MAGTWELKKKGNTRWVTAMTYKESADYSSEPAEMEVPGTWEVAGTWVVAC